MTKNHGILGASLETDFKPALDCVCGYTAIGETWEDAGSKLDQHIDASTWSEYGKY